MSRFILLFLTLLLTGLAVTPAEAQVRLMPYGAFNTRAGFDPAAQTVTDRATGWLVGLGVEFNIPLSDPLDLKFRPSFEQFLGLPSAIYRTTEGGVAEELRFSQSRYQVNADLIGEFGQTGFIRPFIGLGLGFSAMTEEWQEEYCDLNGAPNCTTVTGSYSGTGLGLNLLAGGRFRTIGFVAPFVQARLSALGIGFDYEVDDEAWSTVYDFTGFSLTAGVVIPLGGSL